MTSQNLSFVFNLDIFFQKKSITIAFGSTNGFSCV